MFFFKKGSKGGNGSPNAGQQAATPTRMLHNTQLHD
jgi:hypothetical protein